MHQPTQKLVLGLLLIPILGFSQVRTSNSSSNNFIGVGFEMGVTTPFGDIDEGAANGELKNNLAYKLNACKVINRYLSIEAQVIVGKISGEKIRKSGETVNHQYFLTSFNEYTANVCFNLVSLFSKNDNRRFNGFVSAGAGLISFKSRLYDGQNDLVIDSYGYDGKRENALAVPVSLKLSYNISRTFIIIAQTSTSYVDSDVLDAKAGNDNSDYYNYTSVGFIYKLFLGGSSKHKVYSKKGRKNNWQGGKPSCNNFN